MPLTQGQILNGRYRIVRLLGQGGYGAVYRAWDMTLSQPCALKENLDTSKEAHRQFEREAIVLAGLRHNKLPRVTDHFVIQGLGQYLVLDFIDGRELFELVAEREQLIEEKIVLDWIDQVCDALEYLHTQIPPVIHRDVKPQNIIITEDSQAILVDFGIFKLFDPHVSTTKGARGVTPGFSPPEQYGKGSTDARSDVYSVAATLYFSLTRQLPSDAIDRVLGRQKLSQPVDLNPRISPSTQQAIKKAMELEPENRYQNISALRRDLTTVDVPVQPVKQPEPIAQFVTPDLAATKAATVSSVPQRLDAIAQPLQGIGERPKGVMRVAWYCILSSFMTLILISLVFPLVMTVLGLVGGIMLLRTKLWGWRLSVVYLILMVLTFGLGVLGGLILGDSIGLVASFICAIFFILSILCVRYLYKSGVRSLFT